MILQFFQTMHTILRILIGHIMSEKSILVTWDIDGTLIVGADEAVFIHQNAFKQACEEMFGIKCDVPETFLQTSINGFMDQKILKMMINKCGHEPTQDLMNEGIKKMEDIFVKTCNVKPLLPPGVLDLLNTLTSMPNVTIGIASGNWPKIAWKKLELAGIDKYFRKDNIAELGYFDDRKDALIKARVDGEKLHNGRKFDVCIHIGDTSRDVVAAQNANFIAVAVKTGRNEYEYPKPCVVLQDLQVGRDEFLKLLQ